jgi:excisionase family DNA binding protein
MKMDLVNVGVAARELKVGPQFLRQLAREGKIPSYRLSRRTLRFDLDELKNHMKKIAKSHGGK